MSLDEDLANALRRDWRTANLDDRDRAMLGYVEKVTRDPVSISRADIEALRSAGFDDTGILQINLIASWFNYINRVADGLGVGRQ
ncbi:MAG: peroxidase [Armatimonadota bacterium]|nr:peroxidase [Armatimonadota bacterium]